jgi:WD repeat-containing protein 7
MIGHTSIVNCLAKAGSNKEEEYLVSSSENGEMKLWEINQKKCVENIKMSNTIHKNIYSSKVNGKYTRLFCIGNYTDVLVMDPISLDILYTLVSREQHQWINALCINTLGNKQDEVIVGVSVSGTIKLWTVNAQEQKGSEIVEHEFKNCLCENASTLTSCPGKQRIFIVVCPKFFQIFDAFDFTVLCQVTINSLPKEDQTNNDTVTFISGFFIDVENILICASNGYAYLYMLPDK